MDCDTISPYQTVNNWPMIVQLQEISLKLKCYLILYFCEQSTTKLHRKKVLKPNLKPLGPRGICSLLVQLVIQLRLTIFDCLLELLISAPNLVLKFHRHVWN